MTTERVVSREKLQKILDRLKGQGSRIVFTNGCFDILHAGHVQYLAEARNCGDLLVVGLNSDRSVRSIKGDARPVVHEEDRAFVLASLKMVDYVTIFNEDTPLQLIEYLRPHVIVKGGDWTEDSVVGRETVMKDGGIVKIIPLMEGRSTTNLIEKIMTAYKK